MSDDWPCTFSNCDEAFFDYSTRKRHERIEHWTLLRVLFKDKVHEIERSKDGLFKCLPSCAYAGSDDPLALQSHLYHCSLVASSRRSDLPWPLASGRTHLRGSRLFQPTTPEGFQNASNDTPETSPAPTSHAPRSSSPSSHTSPSKAPKATFASAPAAQPDAAATLPQPAKARRYGCDLCDLDFGTSWQLYAHGRKEHWSRYRLTIQGKVYDAVRSSNGYFECAGRGCAKAYEDPFSLKQHVDNCSKAQRASTRDDFPWTAIDNPPRTKLGMLQPCAKTPLAERGWNEPRVRHSGKQKAVETSAQGDFSGLFSDDDDLSDPPSSDGINSSDEDIAGSDASDDDGVVDAASADKGTSAAAAPLEAVRRPEPSASGSRAAPRRPPPDGTARSASRADGRPDSPSVVRPLQHAPTRKLLPALPNFKRKSTSTSKSTSGDISSAAALALASSSRPPLPPLPKFKKIEKPVEPAPSAGILSSPSQSSVPAPSSSLLEKAEARARKVFDDYPEAAPPSDPEDVRHIDPSASSSTPPASVLPRERSQSDFQEAVSSYNDSRSSRINTSPTSPPLQPAPLSNRGLTLDFGAKTQSTTAAATACPGWSLRLPAKRSSPAMEDDDMVTIERAMKKGRLETDVSADEDVRRVRRSRWDLPPTAPDDMHPPAVVRAAPPSPPHPSAPPILHRTPLDVDHWAATTSPNSSVAPSSTVKRSHDQASSPAADEALDGRQPVKRSRVVKPSGLLAIIERGRAIDAADAVAQQRAVAGARARKSALTPSAGRTSPSPSLCRRPEQVLPPLDSSLSIVRPSPRSAQAPVSPRASPAATSTSRRPTAVSNAPTVDTSSARGTTGWFARLTNWIPFVGG